jgi:hypothetical protein
MPFAISSNEAMGFVFSSCEMSAPVCASMMRVDSQQGQMSVKRAVSVTTETPSSENTHARARELFARKV